MLNASLLYNNLFFYHEYYEYTRTPRATNYELIEPIIGSKDGFQRWEIDEK